jgi:adenine-specific DNA-methyltransferase
VPELVWDGKYDANGRRTAPPRIALPFQTVEIVNGSTQGQQRSLFPSEPEHTEWRNRLIWGDKKYVLPALLDEFVGAVDLVYIDPPFFTGDDFSFSTSISGEGFTREPSRIEQKAYRDTWGSGLDGYLEWFYNTLLYLRELLADTGSIYVHLDWHLGHYAKLVLDEIFGVSNFLNNVVWLYGLGGSSARYWPRKHDDLYWYSKNPDRQYFEASLIPAASQRMRGLQKKAPDYWDIPSINNMAEERVAYPTQKPEKLLERIISSSCPPGGLVLDCFCGSGTTPAVAEKLGRRWIAADLGRFAIHTTRKRLLGIPDVKPFMVQTLGACERQLWQEAEFGEPAAARTAAYRKFILGLYHAQPVAGYTWLHGVKGGRMVHVGTVDTPITNRDVEQVVAEFRKTVGTAKDAPAAEGVDLLGWDFARGLDARELDEVARQDTGEAGIDVRLVRIPREVLEKRAVEQGDIYFFELAALSVSYVHKGCKVVVKLEDFAIPLDEVPADVQKAVAHWSQWVDYWAVDWDNKGDVFHNEWQSYRTRKSGKLTLSAEHEYSKPGEYLVAVKVVDILGNDTTKTLQVKVTGRA